MNTDALILWLETYGLSLCAFRYADLPEPVASLVADAAPSKETLPTATLLLLANVGPQFWRSLQTSQHYDDMDPVDTYSLKLTRELHSRFFGDTDCTPLYPSPAQQAQIPLMRLGALAGWNVPSPLGLGLHPKYGPWSAYRAAWLTQSSNIPEQYECFNIHPESPAAQDIGALTQSADLCVGCAAPCAAACPAQAIQLGESINLERCTEHRLPHESACHSYCFARKACPIGSEHQYDDDQLRHHMGIRWR